MGPQRWALQHGELPEAVAPRAATCPQGQRPPISAVCLETGLMRARKLLTSPSSPYRRGWQLKERSFMA